MHADRCCGIVSHVRPGTHGAGMTQESETRIDPVCGMTVAVSDARADGRTIQYGGAAYVFCSDGCLRQNFSLRPRSTKGKEANCRTPASSTLSNQLLASRRAQLGVRLAGRAGCPNPLTHPDAGADRSPKGRVDNGGLARDPEAHLRQWWSRRTRNLPRADACIRSRKSGLSLTTVMWGLCGGIGANPSVHGRVRFYAGGHQMRRSAPRHATCCRVQRWP